MKKYQIGYVLADYKDAEPSMMPDFIYNNEEEAQEVCNNLNAISKCFIHFIKEINIC